MTALAIALTIFAMLWTFAFGCVVGWLLCLDRDDEDNSRKAALRETFHRIDNGHGIAQIRRWVKTELGQPSKQDSSKLDKLG